MTASKNTHMITCLAGIDPVDHECTCGNTSVGKPFGPTEADNGIQWKRVLDRRLHDLRVLYSGSVVLGFIYKLADTSTGTSQWCCNTGMGDSAKLVVHRWTMEQAQDALFEAARKEACANGTELP